MKAIRNTFVLLAISVAGLTATQAQGPLASWNDTEPKKAVVAFVEKVTKDGSPDFFPPNERIATFDNDGTLWAEQPLYFQFLFATNGRRKTMVRESDGQSDCHGCADGGRGQTFEQSKQGERLTRVHLQYFLQLKPKQNIERSWAYLAI